MLPHGAYANEDYTDDLAMVSIPVRSNIGRRVSLNGPFVGVACGIYNSMRSSCDFVITFVAAVWMLDPCGCVSSALALLTCLVACCHSYALSRAPLVHVV